MTQSCCVDSRTRHQSNRLTIPILCAINLLLIVTSLWGLAIEGLSNPAERQSCSWTSYSSIGPRLVTRAATKSASPVSNRTNAGRSSDPPPSVKGKSTSTVSPDRPLSLILMCHIPSRLHNILQRIAQGQSGAKPSLPRLPPPARRTWRDPSK